MIASLISTSGSEVYLEHSSGLVDLCYNHVTSRVFGCKHSMIFFTETLKKLTHSRTPGLQLPALTKMVKKSVLGALKQTRRQTSELIACEVRDIYDLQSSTVVCGSFELTERLWGNHTGHLEI